MKTAQFYKDKKRAVHIAKKDGRFLNGIIEEVSADYLILIDEKLGEMPVFFLEVLAVEPREKKVVGR